jgi:propanediol dehydratase small subunit
MGVGGRLTPRFPFQTHTIAQHPRRGPRERKAFPVTGFIVMVMVGVIVAVAVAIEVVRWRKLRRFVGRGCSGRQWRRRFPKARRQDIRVFLVDFVDAFALSAPPLAFSPDDKLLDIYRALNPLTGSADALEFETLAEVMESRYALPVTEWSTDITLGELFHRASRAGAAR